MFRRGYFRSFYFMSVDSEVYVSKISIKAGRNSAKKSTLSTQLIEGVPETENLRDFVQAYLASKLATAETPSIWKAKVSCTRGFSNQ